MVAHRLRFGELPGMDFIVGIVLAAALWVAVLHRSASTTPQRLFGLAEFQRLITAVGISIKS